MKSNRIQKKILHLLLVFQLAIVPKVFAQNIAINTTGDAPDTSAMLDITSTDRGFLMPRMTTIQRDAIVLPATGLLIFNTALNTFQANTGTPTSPIWALLGGSQNGWLTNGNEGTNTDSNFVGTTDNTSLVIRTNNLNRIKIDSLGNVGVNTNKPTSGFEVNNSFDLHTDSLLHVLGTADLFPATLPGADYAGSFQRIDSSMVLLNGIANVPLAGFNGSISGFINPGVKQSFQVIGSDGLTMGMLNAASGINSNINISQADMSMEVSNDSLNLHANTYYNDSTYNVYVGNNGSGRNTNSHFEPGRFGLNVNDNNTNMNTNEAFTSSHYWLNVNNNNIGRYYYMSINDSVLYEGMNDNSANLHYSFNATPSATNSWISDNNLNRNYNYSVTDSSMSTTINDNNAANYSNITMSPQSYSANIYDGNNNAQGSIRLDTSININTYNSNSNRSSGFTAIPGSAQLFANDYSIGQNSNLVVTDSNITTTGYSAAGYKFGINTSSPNSTLQVNGSLSLAIKTISSDYEANVTDYTIIKTGNASITLTLPPPSSCAGRIYQVISYTGAGGDVTFSQPVQTSSYGSQYGETDFYQLASNAVGASTGSHITIKIQSDGYNWYSLGL